MQIIKKNFFPSLLKILLSIFYLLLWFLIIKASIHRIGSFAFFDEYSTFVTGYFMLKGRSLFDQIFLNHQLLLSYLSYFLQLFLRPESFYVLVIQHRMSVIAVSFIFSVLLVMRFRFVGMGFSMFFELTKFYLFGSLFLAESLIVYPLAYLMGLIILSSSKKLKLKNYDLLLAAFITWFVFFIREPYAPLVLSQFAILLYQINRRRIQIVSASILVLLTTLSLSTVPLKEYFFQLVSLNAGTVGGSEIEKNNILGVGFLKIFFYPIYIFISGEQNFFRIILILLSVVFLILLSWLIYSKKQYKLSLYIFILLGLANIRFVEPGQIYYVAFHMLPWMSLFVMSIFSLLYLFILSTSLKKTIPALIILGVVLLIGIFHPDSFILQRVNKESEFNDNYIRYSINGQVIKNLSSSGDKLFVDLSDSLVHYYSGLDSSYKYAFFYPVMAGEKLYLEERLLMFTRTPPEFYYYNCYEKKPSSLALPSTVLSKYLELRKSRVETCLYIRKDVWQKLPKEKIESLSEFNYNIKNQ